MQELQEKLELFKDRVFLLLWQDNARLTPLPRGCRPPKADFPRLAYGDVQGDSI